MKRFLTCALICFALSGTVFAQEIDANAPATKEDIQKYFEVIHSRQMIDQTIQAMSGPLRQMIDDQSRKDKDKLPAGFAEKEKKHLDDMLKSMPWDEMMQAMVPAYQKHFTKGDIQALMAFYSSPTGQKLLRELPAIMGESMQAMTPVLKKYMESVKQQVDDEYAQALKESEKKNN